ncbi:MAG: hypothetical protein EPN93_14470 [Spirochaetes bacterium]|nr:MAG: hypothetical protein EPN93_14470 [Spirochaetota bacterium]
MRAGIDAGSKFLKLIILDDSGAARFTCREHRGSPETTLAELRAGGELPHDGGVAVTGHFAHNLAAGSRGWTVMDDAAALVEAARLHAPGCRHIVSVGAGSINCVDLDESGGFRAYRENSLCAAGTGSFLDEQMRRMGFTYEELSGMDVDESPCEIATRCAVFAKSDIIHRQQEGYSRAQMWSGLCRGVVGTMLRTAFHGGDPAGSVLFCGGMFLSRHVRHWTASVLPGAVFRENGNFFPAMGALSLAQRGVPGARPRPEKTAEDGRGADRPRLELARSRHEMPGAMNEYALDGNEVRIHTEIDPGARYALGIDIGSTSTKLALVDARTREVAADIYRKTGGDPTAAARALFRALRGIVRDEARITASATTGSGRRLIGELAGAELIVNEITAHFRGAAECDPGIETIFEIGGQDAKYIRGMGGAVQDCAMNYVCAAGTGSFIEEQASRLGFDVREIGELTRGAQVPRASDRCTVFMEQDIHALLREGHSREEALAGVMFAVAKNYLHRVVGQRPITGDKVFFQGATARNRGLVAAFEILLDREIVVSPHCHVMGAYGAALLALERAEAAERTFRGLSVFEDEISLEYSRCEECANKCQVTHARAGGAPVSWGRMCGREEGGDAAGTRTPDHFTRVMRLSGRPAAKGSAAKTRGRIGIPMTLSMFNYLPLWSGFFKALGFQVVTSGNSDAGHKARGARIAQSDFCFPVKMALAHAESLCDSGEADAVFFPTVISEKNQENGMPRVFCPYVISFPSLVRHAMDAGLPVVAPALDFRLDERHATEELTRSLASWGVEAREVRDAYRAGMRDLDAFFAARFEYGKRLTARIAREGGTGIVFVGRPYNLYDRVINLGLPERFRAMGAQAFPFEALIDPADEGPEIHHMYWNYGERILSCADKIRDMDGIYPIYFTNFGCGPDSFILSRFEKLMRGKPYLIIELDEHGSETGYITRIEAFMDVVRAERARGARAPRVRERFHSAWTGRGRKLWIPAMHEFAPRFTAAAFRAWGFDSQALPLEDEAALEAGRQGVRGSECLPAHTTIGSFMRTLRKIGARPEEHALFMPTAEGPCRFGQYTILHRGILERHGFGACEIFSPTSVNSYMGMPDSLRLYLGDSITAAEMLYKAVCRVRPREIEPGSTDRAAESALEILEAEVERKADLIDPTKRAIESILAVPARDVELPLVGIVGEIYVRCNPFCNRDVVRAIEHAGGEAWLSPIMEWILYTQWMERHMARVKRRGMTERAGVALKTRYLFHRVHRFEKALAPLLPGRMEPPVGEILDLGKEYFPLIFEGEAIVTVGRALRFINDGAAMVVNCAPFGCMPGNVTNAIFQKLAPGLAAPVLTLFYDGTSDPNRIAEVYLRNLAAGQKESLRREAV